MVDALASSLVRFLLGLELGATDTQPRNRVSLEGLAVTPSGDGTLAFGARSLEAAALRLANGPVSCAVEKLTLRELAGRIRLDRDRLRVEALQAAGAELGGLQLQGPLLVPAPASGRPAARGGASAAPVPGNPAAASAGGAWSVAPLASANGLLRARIVDAHLGFDADVTVPLRLGQLHFNEATVAHVGPDSRMGVSRMGVYVDAPNGRSYLFQFSATPLAGVDYERRGALLGAWVTHRGSIQLQPFVESLLRQAPAEAASGLTAQTRLLLGRTALSGELRLGDGRVAGPGVHADLTGRAEGRNTVRLHAEAVGSGLGADIDALSVRDAAWSTCGGTLACEAVTGVLGVRVVRDDGQWRFAFSAPALQLAALRWQPHASTGTLTA